MHGTRREFLTASTGAAAALGLGLTPALAHEPDMTDFSLGLVTYNVAAAWDLPTILGICQRVGISPVELRTTHKHGVEPTLPKAERADVRKRFGDSGVKFWGCGSTCEFHATDPAQVRTQIETCKRFVELTADLGGRGVKVRPNGLPAGVPIEKTVAQIARAVRECGAAAANSGIEIWIEVHGKGTQDPPVMQKIMEQCGSTHVGITWNSNGTDVRDGSVKAAFESLKPYLKSCHINDLENDAKGKYPYRELFRLLRESGYCRTTLIEVGKVYADPKEGEQFLRDYRARWLELKAA